MRRQLALMATATTSMVVLAFLIPLAILVQTTVRDRALNSAELEARSLAPVLATERDPASAAAAVRSVNDAGSGQVTVFLADGSVLGHFMQPDANVALARRGRAFTTPVRDGMAVLVPVVGSDGSIAVIEVVVPNSTLRRGVDTAWLILGALGAALIGLAGLVADRMARSVVAPTRALADAAQSLGQGRMETRVDPSGPPELVEVGKAFNRLAGRIGELLEAERETAADLSHRLRTPLTALRLDVEQLKEGDVASRLSNDVEVLEQVVDTVIRELRSQTGEGIASATDLAEIARGRVAFWAALADEQGRSCRADIMSGSAPVRAKRADLESALDVLIDNVFAHTPEHTAFAVTVRPLAVGKVRLTVEDDGPGMAATTMLRGDSGGRSTGLGLDIVRRVAAAADGSLLLGSSEGGGTRVEVEFTLTEA